MLLERDEVNPDKSDNDGQTPLCCAARDGQAEVVKVLLGRDDVDHHKPDGYGQAPLWLASRHGHAAVVLLLQPECPPA